MRVSPKTAVDSASPLPSRPNTPQLEPTDRLEHGSNKVAGGSPPATGGLRQPSGKRAARAPDRGSVGELPEDVARQHAPAASSSAPSEALSPAPAGSLDAWLQAHPMAHAQAEAFPYDALLAADGPTLLRCEALLMPWLAHGVEHADEARLRPCLERVYTHGPARLALHVYTLTHGHSPEFELFTGRRDVVWNLSPEEKAHWSGQIDYLWFTNTAHDAAFSSEFPQEYIHEVAQLAWKEPLSHFQAAPPEASGLQAAYSRLVHGLDIDIPDDLAATHPGLALYARRDLKSLKALAEHSAAPWLHALYRAEAQKDEFHRGVRLKDVGYYFAMCHALHIDPHGELGKKLIQALQKCTWAPIRQAALVCFLHAETARTETREVLQHTLDRTDLADGGKWLALALLASSPSCRPLKSPGIQCLYKSKLWDDGAQLQRMTSYLLDVPEPDPELKGRGTPEINRRIRNMILPSATEFWGRQLEHHLNTLAERPMEAQRETPHRQDGEETSLVLHTLAQHVLGSTDIKPALLDSLKTSLGAQSTRLQACFAHLADKENLQTQVEAIQAALQAPAPERERLLSPISAELKSTKKTARDAADRQWLRELLLQAKSHVTDLEKLHKAEEPTTRARKPPPSFFDKACVQSYYNRHMAPRLLAIQRFAPLLKQTPTDHLMDAAAIETKAFEGAEIFQGAQGQRLRDEIDKMTFPHYMIAYSTHVEKWQSAFAAHFLAHHNVATKVRGLMNTFLQHVAEGRMDALRAQAPQMQWVAQQWTPQQVQAWKTDMARPGPKGGTVRDTQEPSEMLASVTDVPSCQSVNQPSCYSLGMLGRIMDGSKRMVVWRDARGTLRARAALRLFKDGNGKVVLGMGPVYTSPGVPKSEGRAALSDLVLARAQALGVPAVVTGPESDAMVPMHLESAPGPVLDYWDEISANDIAGLNNGVTLHAGQPLQAA